MAGHGHPRQAPKANVGLPDSRYNDCRCGVLCVRSILEVGRIIFIRASVVAESLRTKLSKGQSLSVEWGALKVQELNSYSDGKKTNRKNNNVGGVNRGER